MRSRRAALPKIARPRGTSTPSKPMATNKNPRQTTGPRLFFVWRSRTARHEVSSRSCENKHAQKPPSQGHGFVDNGPSISWGFGRALATKNSPKASRHRVFKPNQERQRRVADELKPTPVQEQVAQWSMFLYNVPTPIQHFLAALGQTCLSCHAKVWTHC